MIADIYWVATVGAGRLGVMARPRGGDWLGDEVRSLHWAGVDLLVSLLTESETRELDIGDCQNLCEREGIDFRSFPIADRGVPRLDNSTVTFFEQLRHHLLIGEHVVVHCRAGIGRSGLVAAGVLVLDGVAPVEAWASVSRARGLPVPDTEEQQTWLSELATFLPSSGRPKTPLAHERLAIYVVRSLPEGLAGQLTTGMEYPDDLKGWLASWFEQKRRSIVERVDSELAWEARFLEVVVLPANETDERTGSTLWKVGEFSYGVDPACPQSWVERTLGELLDYAITDLKRVAKVEDS